MILQYLRSTAVYQHTNISMLVDLSNSIDMFYNQSITSKLKGHGSVVI